LQRAQLSGRIPGGWGRANPLTGLLLQREKRKKKEVIKIKRCKKRRNEVPGDGEAKKASEVQYKNTTRGKNRSTPLSLRGWLLEYPPPESLWKEGVQIGKQLVTLEETKRLGERTGIEHPVPVS